MTFGIDHKNQEDKDVQVVRHEHIPTFDGFQKNEKGWNDNYRKVYKQVLFTVFRLYDLTTKTFLLTGDKPV